jgi:uncharacterized protein YbbC (DUF1343 family)
MLKSANYNIIIKVIILIPLFFSAVCCDGYSQTDEESIIVGAERTNQYLPLLKDKKIALVVNQTSTIKETHLVDSLLRLGVDIEKVFAPEHGFRGKADAGAIVKNGIDEKSGLPIISLYGSNKKPTKDQLSDIDIVIFDIQDVGARFYTYISTMHYVMEACAENNKLLIILDRPNPNGMYIEGPVLDLAHQSFVGMHPIPILHGLTVGELAGMINNEGWLNDSLKCQLEVIKVAYYNHEMHYSLPIKPSPNLPNDLSIALYPSLCLFEGTVISVGRGTAIPFQQIGHPKLNDDYTYSFIPTSTEGAKYPPFEGEECFGLKFDRKLYNEGFTLQYLINFYQAFDEKDKFFNNFFTKLVGNQSLKEQIEAGFTEEEIKLSWQPDLNNYKNMRKKYLLYED